MLAYAVLVGVLFLAFAMAIVCVVSMWKIFVKAGARGWAALNFILQFLCDDKNHIGERDGCFCYCCFQSEILFLEFLHPSSLLRCLEKAEGLHVGLFS